MSKYGVVAKRVWDGSEEVRIPSEMGTPAPNQMKGTALERLSELAGRSCYDSLGKGRSSEDFHKHILEVKHLSVYGHGAITVQFDGLVDYRSYLNRPGVWITCGKDQYAHRVTLNPRALLDWDYWTSLYENPVQIESSSFIQQHLHFHMKSACPQIVPELARTTINMERIAEVSQLVAPQSDEEKWISLFLAASRGFSHEQVRHGFRTGISQRSTRYVDECDSAWMKHPLIQEYEKDKPGRLEERLGACEGFAKETYGVVVAVLHGWLIDKGVDKLTARKQARGAARGYLGNALMTELVFSASVAQWKRILRQRVTDHADAEIRAVMTEALPQLQASRYGNCFEGFKLVPAADGIGESAVEEKS